MKKKIVFLTGTRADFGKMKPLMRQVESDPEFELHVFVTGMHMLSKYGYTVEEVELNGFKHVYKFINQNHNDSMDQILAKTIGGFSDYVKEIRPNLIVVHGDRVEPLAGAAVGALSNTRTGHIEGGEVSGTVDELIRHAITKLSHIHFVANDQAKNRLAQLGEHDDSIFVIGSPDVDVMMSNSLPSLADVRSRYDIGFESYDVFMFHPVTTELDRLARDIQVVLDDLDGLGRNVVVVYPNNDIGSDVIIDAYKRMENNPRFRLFPSMRFEYFITLMRNCDVFIGNSSAGVREAPHFGVPSVNLGSRQRNRADAPSIVNADIEPGGVKEAVTRAGTLPRIYTSQFGDGRSAERFHDALRSAELWERPVQKFFVDRVLV